MAVKSVKSGGSLTRKVFHSADGADAAGLRSILNDASGHLPFEDRLQTFLDECEARLSSEAAPPEDREHPNLGWYADEIAWRLGKVLRDADPAMRVALLLAFQAGNLWKEAGLGEPEKRLDKALASDDAYKRRAAINTETIKAEASARYAPALAEAARLWSDGDDRRSHPMARKLRRDPRWSDLSEDRLRKELGPLRKRILGGSV